MCSADAYNPADVKAAEKLAKLFDEIKADNFNEDDLNNKENLHHLNIFLSRLLFCYFAEDTEIFKDKQFTSAISKSNEDGSDLSALIGRLFKVLNQSSEDREADLPDYLADFPYVNGGLFKDDIQGKRPLNPMPIFEFELDFQRCGSNSSIWVALCVGSLFSTSLK